MLFGLEFKDLSKFFIRLDDVSLENIIPLKTEQEYTGWRFTFSNEVIWLPIGNVNDVLELARKNRSALDEEEKKRKIKSVEYSILSDLSQEKIKEYHEKKEKGI